jgi:glycosyltransferase involved in cell wall biosynthesis
VLSVQFYILHRVAQRLQNTSNAMLRNNSISGVAPEFSVIIAVYNDWGPLVHCLESLRLQDSAPSFEVIVVDDGSTNATPEFIRLSNSDYPLTLIQQSHAGIPASRNRGVRASKGTMLLFVDADSRLQADCLASLCSTVARFPQHDYFQLRLTGNCSTLVGRAEELRLIDFQEHMLQPDGRIRYLNTAGFAIRRRSVDIESGIFDPVALRGEDTLFLASLIEAGELPLFVPDAIVEHSIPLSLLASLRKDFRSAQLERRMYETIAASGVRIHVTHGERLKLLSSMWKTAQRDSIGRSAWFALVLRQGFKRVLSFGYHYFGRSHTKKASNVRQSSVQDQ